METSFTDKFQPYDGTGIRICENESVSYIYICGIKPTRKIFINNNITLMPVSASANPDDMIGSFMKYGNGNEFQMGILISTLRMVTAQLRITAENPQMLAVQTWNAQHICVQISALLNCDLSVKSSENAVFSRHFAYLVFQPYVFSLVFALTSRNKGKFFTLRRPPYPAVLRKYASLPL